jgi:hypothetical protein
MTNYHDFEGELRKIHRTRICFSKKIITIHANPNTSAASVEKINKRNIRMDVFLFAKSLSETMIEYISSAKTRTSVAAPNVSNRIGIKFISWDIPSASLVQNSPQAADQRTARRRKPNHRLLHETLVPKLVMIPNRHPCCHCVWSFGTALRAQR